MADPHSVSVPSLDSEARARLAEEVSRRGVQPVARELGVSRSAVVGVLSQTARPGTAAIVALAVAQRRPTL